MAVFQQNDQVVPPINDSVPGIPDQIVVWVWIFFVKSLVNI
jgi:hypothetical protein